MARVAKKPAEQGWKREDCEPKGQENYYTDPMDIEGKYGKSDYIPHLIDLIMNKGTVPGDWDEWDEIEAHGREVTNHGNTSTKGVLKELEGGINMNINLNNGQFMYVGVYSIRSSGVYSEQIGRGTQFKQLATSPTARADRGNPQQRVQNFYGNLQRVGRYPPQAHCRERASRTIERSPTAIELEAIQWTSKSHMVTRDVRAQGERENTPEARILNDTIGIDFWHHTVLAISLITIGRQGMDRRRMTPLRRDAEWPLAARMWRLQGARPKATKACADMIINITNSTKLPMKEMVEFIGNLNMDIMNKMRVVNGALTTGKTTASQDRGSR